MLSLSKCKVLNEEDDLKECLKEAMKETMLVVLAFISHRCGPCQRIAPVFEEMARRYPNAVFIKIDVNQCQAAATSQGVSATPTFIFYRNKVKVDQLEGKDADQESLEARIHQYYQEDKDGQEEETDDISNKTRLIPTRSNPECVSTTESNGLSFTPLQTSDSVYSSLECVTEVQNESVGGKMDGEEADLVLAAVGLGWWQVPHLITSVLIHWLRSLHMMAAPILNAPVAFRCSPPQPDFHNLTTPISGVYDSKCLEEEEVQELWSHTTTTLVTNNSVLLGPPSCPYVYYDDDIFQATVTSQWHLICEWEHLQPLFHILFTLGSVVACVIGGDLSDRVGRKTMICVSACTVLPVSLAFFYVTSLPILLALRFIVGVFSGFAIVISYTMVLEVSPPRYRSAIAISVAMTYGLSISSLGSVGYLITHWRHLMLYFCVPSILVVPTAFMMSQSPRWLVRRGRGREASEVLRRAARLNRANASPTLEATIKAICKIKGTSIEDGGDEKLGNVSRWKEVKQCLGTPAMRHIFLAAPVLSFMHNMIWLGIALNANNFTSTSPHQYVMCLGLIQFIGSWFVLGLTQKIGRRVLVGGGLLLSAALLLLSLAVSEDAWGLKWFLVMLPFFLIAAAFEVTYLYTMELMPTFIRTRGATFVGMFGYLGEALAALVVHLLADKGWGSVTVTLGLSGVVGGLCVLPLPETRNKPLPETLQDVTDRHNKQRLNRCC
ncbi:hypothetical protein Pcinc_031822 [Petrolisthes cinctipes]|uniref:Major facilitator superfamily (MFS) profile domain-containing protein n=1 Tax=Petrolisthes cinctipes TaxID=88211 RepID=A0AAE1EVS6_PETCI|nr:hypothetical protein Pcinc_031822 [Petrolisthes cinctipes]